MLPIIFVPPRWKPKDLATPLKEEYKLFYCSVTRYHDQIGGNLAENPELAPDSLPNVLPAIESFTDKMAIILSVTTLLLYIMEVQAIYNETHHKCVKATTPAPTLSGSSDHNQGGPKIQLPSQFNGSVTTAHTFHQECNNYITLNQSRFVANSVKIQWALQLCTGKAANWKCVQLELGETYNVLEHLLSWAMFQAKFKLKWADLNSQEKAQDRFHTGIKQTGSIHQYTETFDKVVLELEFSNEQILASAFYAGLKTKIKMHLVGQQPTKLKELKSLAIILDEEQTTAQGSNHHDS